MISCNALNLRKKFAINSRNISSVKKPKEEHISVKMANIDAYSAAESWIKLNLKEDPNQQLPKHGCYMAYVKCMLNQNILTIPNSDFGKIVKCQFRNVRSKRYGP